MADRLYKDIRFFYMTKGHKLGPFDILRDFSVTTVGDLKMYYNVTKNMYGDEFIVFVDGSEAALGPLGKDRYPSLTMSVDDEGFAVFRWLERSNITIIDCVDNLRELVLGAVKVAKDLGYTKFRLVDDSCVGSSIYSHEYSLSALHFICYGRSLYESILDVSNDYWDEEDMNKHRIRAQTVTWSEIYKHLVKMGADFDFDLTGIDMEAPGSCREVLLQIAALDNEVPRWFFGKYLSSVMCEANLPRFHNSIWTIHI